MITRSILNELSLLISEYPVVTILGPRQAGKTTLAKQFLQGYEYVNLELPEVRQFAEDDPKAFLAQRAEKVILDEIQRVPSLLSYIQVAVDDNNRNGQYILTGSHQLALREAVTQSLAGRTAVLNLYPLTIEELKSSNIQYDQVEEYLFRGFFPRIYDQQQRPSQAYSNYYQTYVERDVRQLINLKDLSLFEKFIKLLAGRVGQVINYHSLSNDTGVTQKTIKEWLSILEASFLIYKLPPYFENFGKRAIKSPKYYFMDTGLLCFLLGIEKAIQVRRDPLVGQIFENLVVVECLKHLSNRGKIANLYFYRDSNGNEVDVLIPKGRELMSVEVKFNATYNRALLSGLRRVGKLTDQITSSWLIYCGERLEFSDGFSACRFDGLFDLFDGEGDNE